MKYSNQKLFNYLAKKTRMKVLFTIVLSLSTMSFTNQAPDLSIVGYMMMKDGIGRMSIELIDAFKGEYSIDFFPTRPCDFTDVPPAVQNIGSRNQPDAFNPQVQGKVVLSFDHITNVIAKGFENVFRQRRKDQIILAYSMFETDRIHQSWVASLNSSYDAVLVPDPYLVTVYQNSGVRIPIFTVPLAINITPFLNSPIKTQKNQPFVFGNLSTCHDRKNIDKIVQGFYQAFGNNPNIRLVLNAKYSDADYKRRIDNFIAQRKAKNISFQQRNLTNDLYLRLFKQLDCYINASQGEGFSIQPREAMALGIPAIVSNNTAQISICNTGLVRVINSPYKRKADYSFFGIHGDVGNFFDTDTAEIARAMRDMYDNYQHYLSKAQQARNWAATFTYNALKPRYRNVIKPKKVILGSENKITEDYLMTNSKELYDKYLKLTK